MNMALEMTRRNVIAAAAAGTAVIAAGAGTAFAAEEVEKQAAAGVITAEAAVTDGTYFGYTSEAPRL